MNRFKELIKSVSPKRLTRLVTSPTGFEELIKSVSPKPSVVVHVGAGSCKEHDFYKSLHPDRIIFVEADPQLAKEASQKYSGSTRVTVVECAIATKSGRQLLKVTNNRHFSSLATPTGLLEFYPNIAITDEVEVETLALKDLCLQTDIGNKTDNILVAELRGLEKEVFPLATTNTLHKFRWIIIRSSKHNLYEVASNRAQISLAQTMHDAGYTVLVFKEGAPPFINILCIRNKARRDNQRLKAQRDDLSNKNRLLERDHAKKIAKLTKLQSISTKKIAGLEKSINAKSSEVSAAQDQIQSASAEKEGLAQQINDLANSLKAKEKELADLQKTLQISNKLILKSDTDLKDLQLQYRVVLQHQDEQHTLLCELKEKLRQASEFYQRLNWESSVLEGDVLKESGIKNVGSTSNDDNED